MGLRAPFVTFFCALARLIAGPVLLATFTGAATAMMMLTAGQPSGQNYAYRAPDYDTEVRGRVTASPPAPAASRDVGVADLGGPALSSAGAQPRWVRLTNPNRHDVLVSALRASVGAPVDRKNRPVAGCTAGSLRLEPPGAVTVPALSTVDVAFTARLAAGAPAACRQARFPVSFSVAP